jgi:opacity protein-like surface antigen
VKKVSAVAFALLVSSGLVHAADMPMAPPIKLWTWTGLYMGGHFGGGWGNSPLTDPAGGAIYGNNIRSDAVLAGVQAGYNWQVPNTLFVLGVETDVSAIGANGSGASLHPVTSSRRIAARVPMSAARSPAVPATPSDRAVTR